MTAIETHEKLVEQKYQELLVNPPLAEILAALWDMDDDDLKLLQAAVTNNNEIAAGKVVLTAIHQSLMYAANIHES